MQRRIFTLFTVAMLCAAAAWPQRNSQRDMAMPQYKVGLENLRAESWDKAAEAFQKAIEIDPSFEMAFYALGKAEMARKRFAEAVSALSHCRDLYLAQTGRQFTNQQEAQRYRRDRIIEIDEVIRQYRTGPQNNQVADTIRQLEDRKRVLQDNIDRGTNVTIDSSIPPFVSLALGSAFFRSGRLPDAEREYKATIEADPKVGEAHSNLAVVYLQTGRIDEAEKSVKAAEKAGFKVNPALKDEIKKQSGK